MHELAKKTFLIGGAGFIGSHITDFLLADPSVECVTVYDNFSNGKEWHLAHHRNDARLKVIRADVADLNALTGAMKGHGLVIHLASNPDIARAVTEPTIDFDLGTLLTNHVVEAMRQSKVSTILYASGSGVYGDIGLVEAMEDYGPMCPISTYAASKLAGEMLISAYVHMFDLKGYAFRFGNVVGARQTHGIGYDFMRRLRHKPDHLQILGDGSQSKSYVHVGDIIHAVFMVLEREAAPYQTYNVATGDYITVNEIATLAIKTAGLDEASIRLEYTGGYRGWRGDVPIVRLNTDRIRALGWSNRMNCAEALQTSMHDMLKEPV